MFQRLLQLTEVAEIGHVTVDAYQHEITGADLVQEFPETLQVPVQGDGVAAYQIDVVFLRQRGHRRCQYVSVLAADSNTCDP